MNTNLPESLKVKEDAIENYNRARSEKQARAKIIWTFAVSFGGFIGGMIFLIAILYSNYNTGVLATGFLIGLFYYLRVFMSWTNKYSKIEDI